MYFIHHSFILLSHLGTAITYSPALYASKITPLVYQRVAVVTCASSRTWPPPRCYRQPAPSDTSGRWAAGGCRGRPSRSLGGRCPPPWAPTQTPGWRPPAWWLATASPGPPGHIYAWEKCLQDQLNRVDMNMVALGPEGQHEYCICPRHCYYMTAEWMVIQLLCLDEVNQDQGQVCLEFKTQD